MTEFYFRASDDDPLPDPDHYLSAARTKGDLVNYQKDGFSDHPHWKNSGYPYQNGGVFITIKCQGIPYAEAAALDYRHPWKDDFVFTAVQAEKAAGKIDLQVKNKAEGKTKRNALKGKKAERLRDYLLGWGCTGIALGESDIDFTVSLFDAVRSTGFWGLPIMEFAKIGFALNSYSTTSGVANIAVNLADSNVRPGDAAQFADSMGGKNITMSALGLSFDIASDTVVERVKRAIKQQEQTFIRQRYCISEADADAVIAAGGIISVPKKNDFMAMLIDKMEL